MSYLIGGVDIETTGLVQSEGHRIIEICISVYKTFDFKDFSLVGKPWTQRFNPLRAIDKKAQDVHGISLVELKKEPEWETEANRVKTILNKMDMVVAHNWSFDIPFIIHEIVRAGFQPPDFQVFCTMENGRGATSMGKVPNLGELCFAFGVDYKPDEAHAADYDVDRMMQCFFKGVKTGFYKPEFEAQEVAA